MGVPNGTFTDNPLLQTLFFIVKSDNSTTYPVENTYYVLKDVTVNCTSTWNGLSRKFDQWNNTTSLF